jgi:hypothetical protein
MKGWKKTFHANGLPRDKEDHFMLIKGKMHQQEITVVYLHVSSVYTTNFIKQELMDLKA